MSQFNGKSYMTKGFASTVPLSVQIMIFTILDEHVNKSKLNEVEVDYLQVFELNAREIDGIMSQEIKHIQEEPSYENKICIHLDEAISEKVFVISDDYGDEGEVITYLLASEY